jgi:hypothetical protein
MNEDLIFFSYNRKDGQFALRLANDLIANRLNPWVDQLNIQPSQRWDAAVEEALVKAQCFLIVLSPHSAKSENVLDEVNFALKKGKKIIPVLIKECEIPFRLERIQYIDFTKNYSSALKQLFLELGGSPTSPIITKETKSKSWYAIALITLVASLGAIFYFQSNPDDTKIIPEPEHSFDSVPDKVDVVKDTSFNIVIPDKEVLQWDTAHINDYARYYGKHYELVEGGVGIVQIRLYKDTLFELISHVEASIQSDSFPHKLTGDVILNFTIEDASSVPLLNTVKNIYPRKTDLRINSETQGLPAITDIHVSLLEIKQFSSRGIYLEIAFKVDGTSRTDRLNFQTY